MYCVQCMCCMYHMYRTNCACTVYTACITAPLHVLHVLLVQAAHSVSSRLDDLEGVLSQV